MILELSYQRFLFLALLFSYSLSYFSQSGVEPSKMKQFNITINFDDYTVKTQMLSHPKDISVNNDRTYMWYASQKIIETKGGYDGKLIHGTYRSFYLNNQLKEQGEIKYGLRNKEWKYWYADGKLKEVINWKKGVKNGSYYLYNDYGQLMAKGNFKQDKLNGKFYTYGPNGNVVDKKKYKKGDEIQPKIKTKKEKNKSRKKLNWFKKKEKKEVIEDKENSSKDKKPFFKRLFKKEKKTTQTDKESEQKIITS